MGGVVLVETSTCTVDRAELACTCAADHSGDGTFCEPHVCPDTVMTSMGLTVSCVRRHADAVCLARCPFPYVGLFHYYPHFVRFLQKRSKTGKASEYWLFQTHNSYDSASFPVWLRFGKKNEVGVVMKQAYVKQLHSCEPKPNSQSKSPYAVTENSSHAAFLL